MAIRTELTLRLQNTPGALARLCQALADERVNVLAMNLESSGVLHLVPENPVHAAGLLRPCCAGIVDHGPEIRRGLRRQL